MTNPDLRVLSLGGGTQSCALALMSAAGDLPRVDHVIFADTQGELPETYAYLDYLTEVLDAAGIPLHVVTAGNLEAHLLGEVRSAANPTPPAHTTDADGNRVRINGYKCSYDFKRRVIERKVKQLCGGRGAWKRTTVEQWIGFSLDEVGRMRSHPWMENRWPLIELGMRRDDTIRWFTANGHPTPPRSACWFCPNSGNDRWRALRDEHPDLFACAVKIDTHIRHVRDFRDQQRQTLRTGDLYLHQSRVPLVDADLRTDRQIAADNGQQELFDVDTLAMDCTAGVCFT